MHECAGADTLEFTQSFFALEIYHSIHANTTHPHIPSSQYYKQTWISSSQICSYPFTLSHTHSLSMCVCFHGAALYEFEKEPAYWDAQARATLDAALKLRPRDHRAKNIILFLGDGRSHRIFLTKHLIMTCGWSSDGKKQSCSQPQWQVQPVMQCKKCWSVFSLCLGREGLCVRLQSKHVSRSVMTEESVVSIKF